jgi:hypothetical protein
LLAEQDVVASMHIDRLKVASEFLGAKKSQIADHLKQKSLPSERGVKNNFCLPK